MAVGLFCSGFIGILRQEHRGFLASPNTGGYEQTSALRTRTELLEPLQNEGWVGKPSYQSGNVWSTLCGDKQEPFLHLRVCESEGPAFPSRPVRTPRPTLPQDPLGSWGRKDRTGLRGSAPTHSWPAQALEKYSAGPTAPLAPFLHVLFLFLPCSVAIPEQNLDLCNK